MEDIGIVLKRAKNAVLSRDFSLALRLYNSLLKEDSGNKEYLKSIAKIYEKTGDDHKALEYYIQLLKISNSDFDTLNSIGSIYRRLKIYDRAIQVLGKALETGINNAEVNYNLGFTYKLMGKTNEAIACFEEAIDENPNDVLAYNHLGSIYYSNGDFNKSIITYKMGLQIDSNHPILQYNLAKSYEAIGDENNASIAYEIALRGKPGWFDAVKDYSALLLKEHKSKNALEIVKKSIALNPQKKELLLIQGKIYFEQSNFEQAEISLQKCLSNSTCNYETFLLFARIYEEEKRFSEAEDAIKNAEKLADDSNYFEIKKTACQIYISSKNFEEAWDNLVILSDNKKSPSVLNLEGQFYIAKNQTEKLEELKKRIVEIKPNYYKFLSDWGKRFYNQEKYSDAKELFKEHISKNRFSLTAQLNLGLTDEKLGLYDSASDDYKMVLRIDNSNFIANQRLKELNCDIEKLIDIEIPNEKLSQEEDDDEVFENSENRAENPVIEEKAGEKETIQEVQKEEEVPEEEKFDFDTEKLSLSQSLLEGEELSDFDYVMPYEDEEEAEKEEKTSQAADNPENQDNLSDIENEKLKELDQEVEKAKESAEKALEAAEKACEAASKIADSLEKEEEDSKEEDSVEEEKPDEAEETEENQEETSPLEGDSEEEGEQESEDSVNEGDFFPSTENSDDEEEKTEVEEKTEAEEENPEEGENSPEEAENQEDDEMAQYNRLVKEVSDLLPYLENLLENKEDAVKYKKELMLFDFFNSVNAFLPEEERKAFLTSRMRIILDFLIAKLSGKPGLLKTSSSLRKSGFFEKRNIEIEDEKDALNNIQTEKGLIRKVINDMKNLSEFINDENLKKALINLAEETQGKIY